MVKEGDELNVEIMHLTGDGKGITYAPDETMIVIENITEKDKIITIRIKKVFEESAFAKKIARVGTESRNPSGPGIVDSPYDFDDDDDDDDDEFGYG